MPGHSGRYRPPKCRRCRRPDSEVPISKRGLCPDCAEAAVAKSIQQMADGSGPIHDKWQNAMRASLFPDEAESA